MRTLLDFEPPIEDVSLCEVNGRACYLGSDCSNVTSFMSSVCMIVDCVITVNKSYNCTGIRLLNIQKFTLLEISFMPQHQEMRAKLYSYPLMYHS